MRLGSIISTFAFLALVSTGCTNTDCYENHSALPLADFYSMQSKGAVSINRLSIYGIGAPGDSILYYDQTLQEAYLPFRLDSDTTRYVFAYMLLADSEAAEADWRNIPSDTITFVYRRRPWFDSPGCGAMYYFDIDSIRHTDLAIDSIYADETITNTNAANIKIFFRTED